MRFEDILGTKQSLLIAAALVATACQGPTGIRDNGTDPTTVKTNPLVLQPVLYDISPPLTAIPVDGTVNNPSLTGDDLPPVPHSPQFSAQTNFDPVVQTSAATNLMPTAALSFEGMGQGFASDAGTFTVEGAPPDPNGDVGPNHYVEVVNLSFTIFDKTGKVLYGPVHTNTLWKGMGGGCESTNDGDGTVRYDRAADRWVIAQFSVNQGNGPFYQCIAVSTTPDPTGSYARYAFQYDAFNDYPKMAVWPDGYYFTYNMFPNMAFNGAKACAMDRAKMLTGAPATEQCFDTDPNWGGLLASDWDGPTAPPAGAPNYLVSLGSNVLGFFTFQTNWKNPASSKFTGPINVPVASFNPTGSVPQPNGGDALDSLSDRLMNRFAYRNFGDHESLVVTHAVSANNGGGVRWYELRNPGASPTVYQQGTFAPDNSYRWISSAAMDKAGDIAIGYSIASSSLNPGISYAGRLAGDALNTLSQGEGTLIQGGGVQNGGLSRWGDYSSMTVDPTDDCTFWYTQEYEASTGSFNWHTRVGAFKFPNCN